MTKVEGSPAFFLARKIVLRENYKEAIEQASQKDSKLKRWLSQATNQDEADSIVVEFLTRLLQVSLLFATTPENGTPPKPVFKNCEVYARSALKLSDAFVEVLSKMGKTLDDIQGILEEQVTVLYRELAWCASKDTIDIKPIQPPSSAKTQTGDQQGGKNRPVVIGRPWNPETKKFE